MACPYPPASAERDAWFAGVAEGHALWRRHLEDQAATATEAPIERQDDEELGVAWWNNMTERDRARALAAAGTAIPAVAWRHWRTVLQSIAL